MFKVLEPLDYVNWRGLLQGMGGQEKRRPFLAVLLSIGLGSPTDSTRPKILIYELLLTIHQKGQIYQITEFPASQTTCTKHAEVLVVPWALAEIHMKGFFDLSDARGSPT